MTSNVQLQTNVICLKCSEEDLPTLDLIDRLGYFELLSYREVNPVLFPLPRRWTDRQQHELEGPRARGRTPFDPMWRLRRELQPIPATKAANPYSTDERAPPLDPTTHQNTNAPLARVDDIAEIIPTPALDEQERFVRASPGDDMLVIAPPGTGKTHVLIERLAWLVATGQIENPMAQVLVVSFTRSAVGELTRRLRERQENVGNHELAYCRVRTFDALATELLLKDLSRDALAHGHSQRISQFTKLWVCGDLPAAQEEISRVRFLFVDEVQDLNGPRAEMVLALAGGIKRAGGAVCFLGDPAQAIYDFEVDAANGGPSSAEFLESLLRGKYCSQPPSRCEFMNYRRFETDEMLRFVRSARSAMGADGLHPDAVQLDGLLQQLGPQVRMQDLQKWGDEGRTAILTRDNLEAFQLWEWCTRNGIEADLWRGARAGYWPGWIAMLVLGFESDSMSMELAAKRWKAIEGKPDSLTFETAVAYLRDSGLLADDENRIPVSSLASRVSRSAPPITTRYGTLVISTIHRSKGLEFDNVLVLSPRPGFGGRGPGADDARIMYVAATRARRKLRLLARDSSVLRRGVKNGRHLQTNHFHLLGYPEYPNVGLLVDGYDAVDPDSVGSLDDPKAAQRRLWAECCGRERNAEISMKEMRVGGVTIGKLAQELQRDIARVRSLRQTAGPYLEGVRIIDLATVVPDENDKAILGAAGLVMIPVTTGIGSC